jgi:hypothetical protein
LIKAQEDLSLVKAGQDEAEHRASVAEEALQEARAQQDEAENRASVAEEALVRNASSPKDAAEVRQEASLSIAELQAQLGAAESRLERVQLETRESIQEARTARDAALETTRIADAVAIRLKTVNTELLSERERLREQEIELRKQLDGFIGSPLSRATGTTPSLGLTSRPTERVFRRSGSVSQPHRTRSVVLRSGYVVPSDSPTAARPTEEQRRQSQAACPVTLTQAEALRDVGATRSLLEQTAAQAMDARVKHAEALEREVALKARLAQLEAGLSEALRRGDEAEERASALETALRRSRAAQTTSDMVPAEDVAALAVAATALEKERDDAMEALEIRVDRQRRERREVLRAVEEFRSASSSPLPQPLEKLVARLVRRETRTRIAESDSEHV